LTELERRYRLASQALHVERRRLVLLRATGPLTAAGIIVVSATPVGRVAGLLGPILAALALIVIWGFTWRLLTRRYRPARLTTMWVGQQVGPSTNEADLRWQPAYAALMAGSTDDVMRLVPTPREIADPQDEARRAILLGYVAIQEHARVDLPKLEIAITEIGNPAARASASLTGAWLEALDGIMDGRDPIPTLARAWRRWHAQLPGISQTEPRWTPSDWVVGTAIVLLGLIAIAAAAAILHAT